MRAANTRSSTNCGQSGITDRNTLQRLARIPNKFSESRLAQMCLYEERLYKIKMQLLRGVCV